MINGDEYIPDENSVTTALFCRYFGAADLDPVHIFCEVL